MSCFSNVSGSHQKWDPIKVLIYVFHKTVSGTLVKGLLCLPRTHCDKDSSSFFHGATSLQLSLQVHDFITITNYKLRAWLKLHKTINVRH